MITTIIITALVSVMTTLVISYFIWQFIRVRKLKQQVKDNTKGIHGNGEWIKNVEDALYKNVDEIYIEMNKRTDEYFTEFNNKIETLDNNSSQAREEINQKIEEFDDTIHRELDKRFEKVYQQKSNK